MTLKFAIHIVSAALAAYSAAFILTSELCASPIQSTGASNSAHADGNTRASSGASNGVSMGASGIPERALPFRPRESAIYAPAGGVIDDMLGPYDADVSRRIKRAWYPPRDLFPNPASVILQVTIAKDGQLIAVKPLNQPQSYLYQDSTLKAIQNAAPFRPLPDMIGGPLVLEIHFNDLNFQNNSLRVFPRIDLTTGAPWQLIEDWKRFEKQKHTAVELLRLAKSQIATGHSDEAPKLLEQADACDPGNQEIARTIATQNAKNYEKMKVKTTATAKRALCSAIWYGIDEMSGDLTKLLRVQGKNPNDSDSMETAGDQSCKNGEYITAILLYRRAQDLRLARPDYKAETHDDGSILAMKITEAALKIDMKRKVLRDKALSKL